MSVLVADHGPVIRQCRTESGNSISVKQFGLVPYLESLAEMSAFASDRPDHAADEIWLIQHPQVYTQGTACSMQPLVANGIPVVKTDRGGQITYHGPGQLILYPLLNLKRYGLGVKSLVSALEQAAIDTLSDYSIDATRRQDAPGVYVDDAKIAALGLRIRRGTSYHGLSLNVAMDLSPFSNIDPCGYQGLRVTQMSDLIEGPNLEEVQEILLQKFLALI